MKFFERKCKFMNRFLHFFLSHVGSISAMNWIQISSARTDKLHIVHDTARSKRTPRSNRSACWWWMLSNFACDLPFQLCVLYTLTHIFTIFLLKLCDILFVWILFLSHARLFKLSTNLFISWRHFHLFVPSYIIKFPLF